MGNAQQTKTLILEAAKKLFIQKGYDNTTVEDIMQLTGLSKGGLYYHFRSKEEIMDAMLQSIVEGNLEQAKKVVLQKEYPIIQRIALLFGAMSIKDPSSAQLIETLHHPQNALLHQKSLTLSTQLFVPLLADLIEEGNNEGLFHTDYPRESAMALFVSAEFLFDDRFLPLTPDEKMTMLKAFLCMAERTVGAAPGSTDVLMSIFQN